MKMTRITLFVFFSCLILIPKITAQKKKAVPLDGEAYRSLTADGAWCWFSDPRAVYHEGKYKRTYTAWVDSFGDIVAAYYDHDSQEISTSVVHQDFEIDDHDNPAIIIDKKGYIMLFYAAHAERSGIRLSKSVGPESIEGWEKVRFVGQNNDKIVKKYGDRYTYANVAYLSKEDKIYLFWRSSDGKPTYSFSADGGYNWSVGEVFINTGEKYKFKRPYLKVISNNVDKIGFAFTEGHPRNEDANSIYFMYLKEGMFRKADGTAIKSISQIPITPDEVDIVYEGQAREKKNCPCSKDAYDNPPEFQETVEEKKDFQEDVAIEKKGKAWIWDIAFDANELPIITYARFPDDENHWYAYARWDGNQWNNHDLINSGKWFPKTPEKKKEWESNYSGGLSIDHENTNKIYLSVKRDSIFEIEEWTTPDHGKSWNKKKLTQNSKKDNIRPFPVRNAKEGNPLQLIWMTNTFYEHYTKYNTALQLSIPYTKMDPMTKEGILNVTRQVADWQIMNPKKKGPDTNWLYGTFYTGLWELYKTTGKKRYKEYYRNVGDNLKWQPGNKIFHADYHTFFQPAIELFKEEKKKKEYVDKIQWVMDIHLDRDPSGPQTLSHRPEDSPYHHEWWTWCDALFMSPPAFARMSDVTGKKDYLEFAIKYWKKTADFLYSPENALYFRDNTYFDTLSKNGKPIFWSRGNGWVFAGLSRFIPYIPKDHPERAYFVDQFKAMATKLISLQDKDGLWRASLLDPEYLDIGESSGSAFFTWGLAWGVNAGILNEKTYRPAIERAWKALVNNVNAHGKLGYVQQVAASPYPFYEHESHLYASGAFIGAGMEVLKLIEGGN